MSEPFVDAITATWAETSEVLSELDAADWDLPTGCPGWTVRDQVSHMIWAMHLHSGRDEPERELPDLPHLGNPMADYMERAVDARRDRSGDEVFEEYEAAREEASAVLRAADLDADLIGPMGHTMPRRRFLTISVFDQWAHGQDIRRAVGRPGDLDSLAAQHSLGYVGSSLGGLLADRDPDLAGAVVAFELTDPPMSFTIGDGAAGATVTMPRERFVALMCGRSDVEPAADAVDGDTVLADTVLRNLAVTP
jgi:uncharacterized protein (TIGR03083 family)